MPEEIKPDSIRQLLSMEDYLRDDIAVKAMAAFIRVDKHMELPSDEIAEMAYDQADAMLKARDR